MDKAAQIRYMSVHSARLRLSLETMMSMPSRLPPTTRSVMPKVSVSAAATNA